MAGPQTREKLGRRSGQAIFNANPDLGRGRRYEPTGIPYDPPKGEPYTPNPDYNIQREGYPLSPMSGLGMIEKGKDIYNKFRPELNSDMFNFNLGNWNFGVGKDKFGFGYSAPFQKTAGAGHRGMMREGIEGLKDKFRWGLTEEEKQYLDTPLREPSGIGFGGGIVDKFRANNPEATIQDLYNYLEEQGRSFQPGDMLDPGDWYNWPGEDSMEYSI